MSLIISTEFQRVATLLGLDYQRALSLEEANWDGHYREYTIPILMYVGISNIAVSFANNPAGIDNYAVEFYLLAKAPTTDETGEQVDVVLEPLRKFANDVIFNFDVVDNIDAYVMQGVSILDDMLIGYKVDAIFPINYVC